MSQAEFDKALYTKLTGSGALDANLSSRFHDTQPPSDANGEVLTNLPLIVFTIVSDTHPPNFNTDHLDVLVQFDLWSKQSLGTEAAKANNDLLNALLNRGTMTMVGVVGIIIRTEDRGVTSVEGDAIRILSQYSFKGTGS